jgi:hypothetical protein
MSVSGRLGKLPRGLFCILAHSKPGTSVKAIVKCRLIFRPHDLSSNLPGQSKFFISYLGTGKRGRIPGRRYSAIM